MGKRARAKGIANVALRVAASELRRHERVTDAEAQEIAREVYAAAIEIRDVIGRAPLWAMAPLSYVAQMTAEMTVKSRKDLTDEDFEDVAGYLMHGLSDLLLSMVANLDVEDFRQWQQGSQAAAETAVTDREEWTRDGADADAGANADAARGRIAESQSGADVPGGEEAQAEVRGAGSGPVAGGAAGGDGDDAGL